MDSEGFLNLADKLSKKDGGKYALSVSITNTKLIILVNRS